MIVTKKIRLKPSPEQEVLFKKSAGVARWAYNFYLSENEHAYQEYLKRGKTGTKSISETSVRKYINNVLKPTTHTWLKEVGSNVMKQGVKDADLAYKRFFKGWAAKPKFKSKHKCRPAFYVNYETLKRKNGGFQGEKIGFVKTSEPLPKLKKGSHYMNPRVTFDGKYWYISIHYEIEPVKANLQNGTLGIDLGVKNLATCSDGKVYRNINKMAKVKKLKRKLKRNHRCLMRRYRENILKWKGHKPVYKKDLLECKNYQKQKRKLQLIYRKISNIRENHSHQVTTAIVKTKHKRIAMETLDVMDMLKNKALAESIKEQRFYDFKRQVQYKCEKYGISFIEVPRFFPSSKQCSHCGNVKHYISLSTRTYTCTECGLTIDRDLNAAINIANYRSV